MGRPEVALWWDSDEDRAGRPLRPDVRAAAHGIWDRACRQAESLISDSSQAADIMESSVAQVSRYLDRGGVAVFSRQIDGLLMLAFQRALYRRVAKLRRVENWGGTGEISHRVVDRVVGPSSPRPPRTRSCGAAALRKKPDDLGSSLRRLYLEGGCTTARIFCPCLAQCFLEGCSPSEDSTEERSLLAV